MDARDDHGKALNNDDQDKLKHGLGARVKGLFKRSKDRRPENASAVKKQNPKPREAASSTSVPEGCASSVNSRASQTPPKSTIQPPAEPPESHLSPLTARGEHNAAESVAVHSERSHSYPGTELWDQAYDKLKADDPNLVLAYEGILSRKFDGLDEAEGNGENVIAQNDLTKRHDQMADILRVVLSRTDKPTKVESGISTGMNVFFALKAVVDAGIKASEIAATAWAAVCVGLQLPKNTLDERDARRECIATIALKMKWITSLSPVALARENEALADLRETLRGGIVEFYKDVLACLFKCICAGGAAQAFKDALKLDDWKQALEAVVRREQEFASAISLYGDARKSWYLENLLDLELAKESNKVLKQLYVVNMYQEIKVLQDRKDHLIPESSDWILSNDIFVQFKDWRNEDHSRRLWIKGKAGMGKTMLLISIIQNLQIDQEACLDSPQVLYYFCQGIKPEVSTATSAVRGLIWMLLQQKPRLIRHATGLAGQRLSEDESTLGDLKDLFMRMLQDPDCGKAYVIIDALDECQASASSHEIPGRAKLLEIISKISETCSNVKILVSSRDEQDIVVKLSNHAADSRYLQLELRRDILSGAIREYIKQKIDDLQKTKLEELVEDEVTDDERELVSSGLKAAADAMYQKADGTFLWVALVFARIRDEDIEVVELQTLIEQLPSDLEGIYSQFLNKAQMERTIHARACVMAMMLATIANRPLAVDELALLAEFPKAVSVAKLLRMCRFFRIENDEHGRQTVYMIHHSAKQWLEQQLRTGKLTSNPESDQIFADYAMAAQASLAERCIRVLTDGLDHDVWQALPAGDQGRQDQSQPPFGADLEAVHHAYERETKNGVSYAARPTEAQLQPLKYAIENWFYHLLKSSPVGSEGMVTTTLGFLETEFIYWLEAVGILALIDEGTKIVLQIAQSAKEMKRTVPRSAELEELALLAEDAKRFMTFFHEILESDPIQVYSSGLLFSPSQSRVRRLFESAQPPWLISPPMVEYDWSWESETINVPNGSFPQDLAFSPDGSRLACGAFTDLYVWSVHTNAMLQRLEGHKGLIKRVAYSHDGKQLSSSDTDNVVLLWDAVKGVIERKVQCANPKALAFSPLGSLIAIGCPDASVHLINTRTGDLQQCIKTSSSRVSGSETPNIVVTSLAFSHDAKTLAIGLDNGNIDLRCPSLGVSFGIIEVNRWIVEQVMFPPCDGFIASLSQDHCIRLWSIDKLGSHAKLESESNFKHFCTDMSFSPISRLVALNGSLSGYSALDGYSTIKLWDPWNDRVEMELRAHHQDDILALQFSPDGRKIATCSWDSTIRIRDLERETVGISGQQLSSEVLSLALSHNGRTLASVSVSGVVTLWDCSTGKCMRQLLGGSFDFEDMDEEQAENEILELGQRYDPHRLAFSADDLFLYFRPDCQPGRIWNLSDSDNEAIVSYAGTSEYSELWKETVSISPDRCCVATGTWCTRDQGLVVLWDAKSGDIKHVFEAHGSEIEAMSFTQDSKLVAYAAESDQTHHLQIRDVETGSLVQDLEARSLHLMSSSLIAFSQDGKRIAWSLVSTDDDFCSMDIVDIWGVETGQKVASIELRFVVRDLSLNSDGTVLETDKGDVPVTACSQCSVTYRSMVEPTWSVSRNGWLLRDGQELLWMPWEYRPSKLDSRSLAVVRGNTVAIACNSGRVCIFMFDRERLPKIEDE